LFFQWIKQNLRIEHFFGTSDNAVKTQVWIALCVCVLVAIGCQELRLELSLSPILQILSVNAFEPVLLVELVAQTTSQIKTTESHNPMVFNTF
jgi:Na+/serine symporter